MSSVGKGKKEGRKEHLCLWQAVEVEQIEGQLAKYTPVTQE